MKRIQGTPRKDWQTKVESQGFFFHSLGTSYWNENAHYEFTEKEISKLERATNELHMMCLEAVDHVISHDRFAELSIPVKCVDQIIRSWRYHDLSIYGRFDLAFDGGGEPKLLEYNADTPTSLLEASVIQWRWLKDTHPHLDQFNSIHERLVLKWRYARLGKRLVHFASVGNSDEDICTVEYLMDTAIEAGLVTRFIPIEEIGWQQEIGKFVDQHGQPIELLFKLYPWEFMHEEQFGKFLRPDPWIVFEPVWKMILSNKGILSILWELFPGHPNLLPAYHSPEKLGSKFVKKPLLSREGANIEIVLGTEQIASNGKYGKEGHIFQEYSPLPVFDEKHAVIGSWVIDGLAAGIGIREDFGPITCNTSNFVPHVIN